MDHNAIKRITDHYRQAGETSRMEDLGEWLDSSKVNEFYLCPKRYYYRHELNLVPFQHSSATNFADAMHFGHALHAALATFYDGTAFDPSTCPCPFEPSLGCLFCKGERIPRIFAQFLLNYPDDPIDDRDPRTRDRGLEILQQYITKWRREPFQVIGVEIPFARPFDGFTYIGRIDLLKLENGRISPMDHKTASRFGDQFLRQFKLSGQITGYIDSTHIILQEAFPDLPPVTEGDINAIRVTTKIQDESFLRITTSRSPAEIAEWRQEVQDVFEHIKWYRQRGNFPKRAPFACHAYMRPCDYLPICEAQPGSRENIIANQYEVNPWNPITED